MKRFRWSITFLLLFLASNVFAVPSVQAFSTQQRETVIIPKDQTIEGSVLLSGQSISVEGTVNGDVYCAGQDIAVSGTVHGDIICAGQKITISGKADGNVRAAGQTVALSGSVTRNSTLFGQHITSDASISGELLAAGQDITTAGTVVRESTIYAQIATVNGIHRGSVQVTAETVRVGTSANISRAFTYESPTTATIATGASISGAIQYKKMQDSKPTPAKSDKSLFSGKNSSRQGAAYWFVIALIAGILLSKLVPGWVDRVADVMEENPLRLFGLGFLLLITIPVGIILLFVTIIGIPFAVLLSIAYAAAIALSRVVVGLTVGRMLVTNYWSAKKRSRAVIAGVGIGVVWIMFYTPVVGGFASFLAVLWGLGGMWQSVRPPRAKQK